MNNRVKKSHLPAFLLNNRTKLPSQRPKTASHRYRSSKQRPQRPSTSNPIRRSSKNRSRSDLSTQLDVLLHSQPKTIERRAAIYSACLKSLSQQITDVETSRLLIKLKEGIDKIHTDHQTLLIATQKENLQLKQQLQQQHYKRSSPPQDVLTSFTLNDNEDELQSTDSEEEMLNDSRLILTEIDQLNRPEDFIELETIESDPNEEEMEAECKRKMDQLYAYDCLRANKSMGDWGIETRVPFLDNVVVDYAMNGLSPGSKLSGTHPEGPKAEKWFLRQAFEGKLPDYILKRTKAQFSDAVGSEWIDALQVYASKRVSDEMLTEAVKRWPYQTPETKEAYLYREFFSETFEQVTSAEATVIYQPSIACSTGEAAQWHTSFQNCLDPSGDAIHRAFEEA